MDGHLRDLYESIKDEVKWVQPYWQEISDSLANELDPDGFLRQRQILDTMNPLSCSDVEFYGGVDWLPFDLREPMFGGQKEFSLGRSANFYRQLYHLISYESTTNKEFDFGDTWAEWGGGYGLQAYIVNHLFDPQQYVIIDLPIFTVLQYHFLSSVLPDTRVEISADGESCDAEIVLVPQGQSGEIGRVDNFISTWALSESPPEAIDYVINDRLFFEADNILTAFQTADDKFPFAQSFGDKLNIQEIEHIPGNYYGFR